MTTPEAKKRPDIPTVSHPGLPDNTPLLDVREQDEWERGHAPGAIHIPLSELPDRLGELPRGGTIVVTCRSGGRASRAVAFLREHGYDAVNLDGGMLQWQQSNRPMTRVGAGAPEVR